MIGEPFAYSNVSTRPRGPLLTVAGALVPGVARVQRDVAPFAAAWEQANRAALTATGPLWVALGDSLSQGVGASRFDRGWVGQLRGRLTADGGPWRLVNLSVSGARAGDVLDVQLPALARLSTQVGLPDLVTLMIGSNDLVHRGRRSRLPQRMDRILRQLPPGSVVTTLPNPTPTATAVNAVVRHVAGERGLVVADLRDPRTTNWRNKLAADHFHPNDRGYAALADVIENALTHSRKSFP